MCPPVPLISPEGLPLSDEKWRRNGSGGEGRWGSYWEERREKKLQSGCNRYEKIINDKQKTLDEALIMTVAFKSLDRLNMLTLNIYLILAIF